MFFILATHHLATHSKKKIIHKNGLINENKLDHNNFFSNWSLSFLAYVSMYKFIFSYSNFIP